jgi:two-component system response regulator AtoC
MQEEHGGRTVLVAEDDAEVRNYLELALKCQGFQVQSAQDGEEVLLRLNETRCSISVLLLDIMMPRKDGMETLREVRRMDPALPVIMLSGVSSPLRVVEAMKAGANDFLGKPVNEEDLEHAIHRALQAPPVASSRPFRGAPVSGSHRMQVIQRTLQQIGASDVPVLLQGESGVGKEVLARQLHEQSPRAKNPFLKVNCAALPSELLESELFGYERGAFTGAVKDKPGKFELADGGTILLDEIGDLDLKLQAKLLHVLQDQEYQRLGGRETVRVNVRVLAATHRNLEELIRQRQFREDLYYRLNVISIQVPPLRERRDEIVPLARHFLKKHAPPHRPIPELSPELEEALLAHDWPGNIRELENLMRRFLVFQDTALLTGELIFDTRHNLDLSPPPAGLSSFAQLPPPSETPPWPPPVTSLDSPLPCATLPPPKIPDCPPVGSPAPLPPGRAMAASNRLGSPADIPRLLDQKKRVEIETIVSALRAAHWNRRRAAGILNIDYKALLYKLKKLGLEHVTAETSAALIAKEMPFPLQTLDQLEAAQRQAEMAAIQAALEAARWNRKRAARLLKLDYKALLYKMKKLGIGDSENGDLPAATAQ